MPVYFKTNRQNFTAMAIDSRLGLVYSIAGPFLWEMRRPGHSRRCVLLKELLTLFLTFAADFAAGGGGKQGLDHR